MISSSKRAASIRSRACISSGVMAAMSIALRTKSSVRPRPLAMPATNCASIESRSESAISRCASDMVLRAKVSAKVLYSPMRSTSSSMPKISQKPPRNMNSAARPMTGARAAGEITTSSAALAT